MKIADAPEALGHVQILLGGNDSVPLSNGRIIRETLGTYCVRRHLQLDKPREGVEYVRWQSGQIVDGEV